MRLRCPAGRDLIRLSRRDCLAARVEDIVGPTRCVVPIHRHEASGRQRTITRNRPAGEQKEYEFSETRSNLLIAAQKKEKYHHFDSLPTAFARVGEGHRVPFALKRAFSWWLKTHRAC